MQQRGHARLEPARHYCTYASTLVWVAIATCLSAQRSGMGGEAQGRCKGGDEAHRLQRCGGKSTHAVPSKGHGMRRWSISNERARARMSEPPSIGLYASARAADKHQLRWSHQLQRCAHSVQHGLALLHACTLALACATQREACGWEGACEAGGKVRVKRVGRCV